jgi:prepilin-type N-terminal cleavage/methylation domain-containing protein/prepilin-type processing-associated H-X9-DG protein
MKTGHPLTGLRAAAFTLIELLLVVAIIAILASLLMPAIGTMQQRANSISCANNLRTIGMAVQLYLAEHSQNYPEINPAQPPLIYDATTPGVQTMVQAFGPYGVSTKTLQCPSDIKQGQSSSFQQYGNSYDWRPTLDDENSSEPILYGGRGRGARFGGAGTTGTAGFVVKLTHVRQVYDDSAIHFGHMNALYADGHVIYYQSSTSSSQGGGGKPGGR